MENTSLVKYLLLALAAPIWWPVLRALWVEVNRMLVEDGGVFGRPPTGKEVTERKAEIAELGDSLVHEPLASELRRAGTQRQGGGKRAPNTVRDPHRPRFR